MLVKLNNFFSLPADTTRSTLIHIRKKQASVQEPIVHLSSYPWVRLKEVSGNNDEHRKLYKVTSHGY